MLQIVQAFDRAPIAEIPTDDAAALEAKLEAATQAFRNRDGWPKPHERIAVLRRLETWPKLLRLPTRQCKRRCALRSLIFLQHRVEWLSPKRWLRRSLPV